MQADPFRTEWHPAVNPYPFCDSNDVITVPDRFSSLGPMTRIGYGSTGTVYRIDGEKPLALKVIECRNFAAAYRNAVHEAEAMERLKGAPHIIQLIDHEIREMRGMRTAYLLEEYCPSFSDTFSRQSLTVSEALNIVLELCDALIECREHGLMHLDIQFRNIFVDAFGSAKLGDFSSALLMDEIGSFPGRRGTLAYMAPEVYRGELPQERSEICSLGIVLFSMFNRLAIPFDGRYRTDTAAFVRLAGTKLPAFSAPGPFPGSLYGVLEKACAFQPGDRYQTYEEFREAVMRLALEADRSDCGRNVLPCNMMNLYSNAPDCQETVPVFQTMMPDPFSAGTDRPIFE